jgi:hypothetical protein
VKQLNRENIVLELREVIFKRFGSIAKAGRMLGMSNRELSRIVSVGDARVTVHFTQQLALLHRLGYDVRFTIRRRHGEVSLRVP